MKWENVSIFISSTFQDMHAERDYLVKEIFPELLVWCESHHLHMYDIDLRWGITREDSANNNTVAACLHNIDRCRPFFVCFLGQRRGWVPGEGEVSDLTREEYPQLHGLLGNTSVTEMEIEHALLSPMNRMYEGVLRRQESCRRALFYFRSDSYTSQVPPGELSVYRDTPENLEKVRLFKETIASSGYPVTAYDCVYEAGPDGHGALGHFTCKEETLGQVIIRQLKEQIAREFPDHMAPDAAGAEKAKSSLTGIQEEFIWREEQSYYPQQTDLDELKRYLLSNETKALCVTGRSGMGKTSLLCACVREYQYPSRLIPRFCGVSPDTADLYSLLTGIMEECGQPIRVMERELYGNLDKYLGQIAAQQSTVLILDGLNQCRDGLRLLELLPRTLPDGLKMILSCKEESLKKEWLEKIRTYETVRLWPMKTTFDEGFKRGMIDRFLYLYLKKLDEESIRLITLAEGADSPLFISIILSELRVFGNFAEIEDQIRQFGGNTEAAFSKILDRLEKESCTAGGFSLSSLVFGLLSCSRNGLSEQELLFAIRLLADREEEDCRPALRILLRQVRPFLARRGSLYDFFHESFRNAAYRQYAGRKSRYHAVLAETFYALANPAGSRSWTAETQVPSSLPGAPPADEQSRPLMEYPYHLAQAGHTEKLEALLMDPEWMSRKMHVCGMQALLYDYEWAKDTPACRLTGGALRLGAAALMRDASQLPVQLTARLYSWKDTLPEIHTLLSALASGQSRFWLRPVNEALTPPGERELFIRHGAYAVTAMCIHLDHLVCSDEKNRIGIYDRNTGEQLRLIQAEGASVRCLASDGIMLYAGCGDGTVTVWHTQAGACTRVLQISDCALNDLQVTRNVLHAADEAGYCIEYDITEDRVQRRIRAGKEPLLAVTADGKRVCFGGMNQKVTLTEERKNREWKTGSGYTGAIVLSGNHLVYSTFYPRIFFRNLETGEEIVTDYTDGYDFAVWDNTFLNDSKVINDVRKKGPYIRDLICLGDQVAVATPFSTALFPLEGAKEPATVFSCHDARALSFVDGVIYVGDGDGRIFSFRQTQEAVADIRLPVHPIISIAREGRYLAAAYETTMELYEAESCGGEEHLVRKQCEEPYCSGIPGYFTDVVPWMEGFAAASFNEDTQWKGFLENSWTHIHQHGEYYIGMGEQPSHNGTVRMVPMRDRLVFLTKNNQLFFKSFPEKKDGELSLKSVYSRTRLLTDSDPKKCAKFCAVAGISDTVFAAASLDPPEIRLIHCEGGSVTFREVFPVSEKVKLMESAPDGLLYILGESGTITCWNPWKGLEHADQETGTVLRIPLAGTCVSMAVTKERIYVSLPDGYLEVFDRMTGTPCFVMQADSDIRSICAYEDRVYGGTENGRLMALREENTGNAGPCDLPLLADMAKRLQQGAGEKDGCRPVIRTVPSDDDTSTMKVVRLVCAFVPLVVTLIAIIVRGGWPGLVSAITMGAWETGKKWRAISMVIMYSMFLLFNIMVISLLMIGADKYYKNIRRWVRSRKLPVLDRYILPLLYILMAVPGLLLTAQPETYPNALWFELTVPVIFTFLYFIIVGEAFQYTGLTKKLSRDKTFLSIAEAFYNLRIAVAALGFLFIAAASWIAIAHPQWL